MTAYMPKSKNDKWGTPKEIYDKLNAEFSFNFDPLPYNLERGRRRWTYCRMGYFDLL